MYSSYNEACAKECSSLELDLELCEQAGFDYIEIRLDMLKEYLKKHDVNELSAFFKKSHLKPHALNAIYLYPEFLSEEDEEKKQKELLEEFYLACRTGREIGSHYVIIVPPLWRDSPGEPFQGDREKVKEDCIRILRKLSALAKPYEMKLCFELVGFERSSVRTIEAADEIVRRTDCANVGFVFDSYNIYLYRGCNDFSRLKQVQPEKIFAVHLMSGDPVPEEEWGQDKRCFPGTGVVDTDSFLRCLKEIGYKGMVSVETFRPEYWKRTPKWVVETAYGSVVQALKKNECFDERQEVEKWM